MTPTDRPSIRIRLHGGDYANGGIPPALDEGGRIKEIQGTSLTSASSGRRVDSSLYWSEQATVGRVATARPLESPEALIIDGIEEEEINELLRAIKA